MSSQLVAYSGFSATNYGQEPYSADLDFGTGEFSLGAWVSYPPTRVNLLTKTAQFIDGAWTKQTGTTVTDNTVLAADGTMTGATVSWASADFDTGIYQIVIGASGLNTKSIYVRADTAGGTVKLVDPMATNGSTIVTLTTAWQRVVLTETQIGGAGVWLRKQSESPATIYISNPQFELSSTVTRYQRVNTITDYDGYNCIIAERAAASGPSLKLGVRGDMLVATAFDGTTTRTVTTPSTYNNGIFTKAVANYTVDGKLAINVNGMEVASATGTPLLSLNTGTPRHNLLTKTEDFTDPVWGQIGSVVVPNAIVAPDGTLTADRIDSLDVSGDRVDQATGILGKSGDTYTYSVYLKGSGTVDIAVNTTTGQGGAMEVSCVLTDYWVRHTATATFTSAVTGNVRIHGVITRKDGVAPTVYAWGAQLETGFIANPYQRVGVESDYDTAAAIKASLTIGNSRTLDAPFPGSITMLKLGATVPTPEQAVWMYEQEKQMFRAGAQVTLPEATPVLDLGYDESQDKWVAVQAGFESSFTGLIRTATATPSAGNFSKVVAGSGVKALARNNTSPGVDIQIPAYGLREELVKRAEAAAKASKTLTVFDFDSVAGQTDFVLPLGWKAASVVSAGNTQREGATKNFTRLFDGFRETIRFAVAPGAVVWVRINAIKE